MTVRFRMPDADDLSDSEVVNTWSDVAKLFKMEEGDWGSLLQLFFDNLSSLISGVLVVQNLANAGVDRSVVDDIMFGKIVPGMGVQLILGNGFFAWQAVRMSKRFNRPYTAQPYGLSISTIFAFSFGILYNIYFSQRSSLGNNDAFVRGYDVILTAHFTLGLIKTTFGYFGRVVLLLVPPAALLIPLAGIGVSFLGVGQLSESIAAPLVGYVSIIWMYLGYFAGVKIGYGKYRLPEAFTVIFIGSVLGWLTGLNTRSSLEDARDFVKWSVPSWEAERVFQDFHLVRDYFGIVIPLAFASSASTLLSAISAKEVGDPYPVRESMIADGIVCMIGAFLGSPFTTVVYSGHPAYKRAKASPAYSMWNGNLYLLMCFCGLYAIVAAVVNSAAVGPVVFMIGISVFLEALKFIPPRHYPAFILGLFPYLYDWAVVTTGRSPIRGFSDAGSYNRQFPSGIPAFVGVLAWQRGQIIVSLIWTAIMVQVLDRQWPGASMWSVVGAVLALFGVIHVPEAGLQSWNEPVWQQCERIPSSGAIDCFQHAEQWMFFVGYLILAVTLALIEVARKFDKQIPGPLPDTVQNAYEDWFDVEDDINVSATVRALEFELQHGQQQQQQQQQQSAERRTNRIA